MEEKDKIKVKISIEKIVLALIAGIVALVALTPLPKVMVVFIERFIIHRPSVDSIWLIRDIRLQTCLILGFLFFFILYFRKDKYIQFFSGYTIFMFVASTINIILTPEYQGYRSTWDYEDFIASVQTGYGDFYGTNYPPLTVLMFKFLHISLDPLSLEQRKFYIYFIVFVYFAVTLLFLFCQLSIFWKENDRFDMVQSFRNAGILFLTGPMLFCIQRGNIALIALVFLSAFFFMKDSLDKKKRHLSSVMLALAANVKFYPAVYGLIYFKEKKYKEAILAFIYGIAFFSFLIPFQYGTLKVFADEVDARMIAGTYSQQGILGKIDILVKAVTNDFGGISIKGIVDTIYSFLGANNDGFSYTIVVIVFTIVAVVLCVLGFFKAKRKDLELALLGFLCIMVPPVSAWYSLVFLVFPLIILLRDIDTSNVTGLKKIEIVLYVITFVFAEFNGLYVGPGYNWYFILLVVVTLIDAFWGDKFEKKGLSV